MPTFAARCLNDCYGLKPDVPTSHCAKAMLPSVDRGMCSFSDCRRPAMIEVTRAGSVHNTNDGPAMLGHSVGHPLHGRGIALLGAFREKAGGVFTSAAWAQGTFATESASGPLGFGQHTVRCGQSADFCG